MTLEKLLAKRDKTLFDLYFVLAFIIGCFAFMLLNLNKVDTGIPASFIVAGGLIVALSVFSFWTFQAIKSWTKQILGWEKIIEVLYESPEGWQKTLLGFEKDRLPAKDAIAFFEAKGQKGKAEQYHQYLVEQHVRLSALLGTFGFQINDRRDCETELKDLERLPSMVAILPNLRMNEGLQDDPILAVRPGGVSGGTVKDVRVPTTLIVTDSDLGRTMEAT